MNMTVMKSETMHARPVVSPPVTKAEVVTLKVAEGGVPTANGTNWLSSGHDSRTAALSSGPSPGRGARTSRRSVEK